jgi:hypothetical protein
MLSCVVYHMRTYVMRLFFALTASWCCVEMRQGITIMQAPLVLYSLIDYIGIVHVLCRKRRAGDHMQACAGAKCHPLSLFLIRVA